MNPPPPTDWMSATAMLLCGLVLGFMFILSLRKKTAPVVDLEREDLEAKRDALVARLREVEDDAEERARLEQETADVLRRLDGLKPAATARKPSAAAPAPAAPPSQWRGFAWGAGSVAVLAAVAFFVSESAKERAPNDGLTGGGPPMAGSSAPAAAAPDAELQQLEATVRGNPNDLNVRHALMQAYFDRDNFMGVFEQASAILEKSPNDARAMTFQAMVWARIGQMERAVQMLETATRTDPSLLDSWITLAWLRMQSGDDGGAAKAIEGGIKAHPDQEARLRDVLSQMRARMAEMAQQQAQQPPAPAPAGPSINVTVNVDPSVRVAPGAVLFVIARAAGVTSGPPIAAKRLPATGFPLSVSISQSDSMMGQPLPDRIRLDARIDTDGVATTRDPSEPNAAQDGVATGSTVTLTLK